MLGIIYTIRHSPLLLYALMTSLRQLTQNFHGNLFGGLTAAIVALPLALAFGISSGAGPAAGLYGAIILGFFAALFGGTATQISGPTGPMTVVMTATITQLMAQYPEQGMALAFTTVFLGGCLQILFGHLKLGKYIIMVPYPVISGFMTGIGVIIILLELAPLLGFPTESKIIDAVRILPKQLLNPNLTAVLIGALTLAVIYLWRGKVSRVIPSPLLALLIATVAMALFGPDSAIDQIGPISAGLPNIQLTLFGWDLLPLIFTNALMLAVLGAIDSLLTSLVADNITGTQHDSDRELVGQGIGNALAGMMGGLPGAGATMRTMVNIRAGGTGPLSGMIHALILLAIVLGLGFLFENIPLAALAGILIKVGIDIIDWPFVKRLHRLPRFPVALMLLVFLITVFVDLITAVFIGVFIKNLVTIQKLSDLELGSLILTNGENQKELLTNREIRVLEQHQGEALLLKITGPLSYAVARGLTLRLKQYVRPKLLVIDLTHSAIIGISTAMVLEELIKKALEHGTPVKIIDADPKSHGEIQQLGLYDRIGPANCLQSLEQLD